MKKEYNIPENWNDVKIKDYLKFYQSIKPFEGMPEFADKLLDRASLYLCGIDSDTLRHCEVEVFNNISNLIYALISSSGDIALTKSFKIGDIEYGFIPHLDSMTYGEYIDLVEYSKDTWKNLPIILSILYRPIVDSDGTGRYTVASYKGTDDTMVELFTNNLTMDVAFGAVNFFLTGLEVLLNDILRSSIATILNQPDNTQLKKVLIESGVPMEQLSNLQMMIQQKLMKQQS
jgi:hypothetical protein